MKNYLYSHIAALLLIAQQSCVSSPDRSGINEKTRSFEVALVQYDIDSKQLVENFHTAEPKSETYYDALAMDSLLLNHNKQLRQDARELVTSLPGKKRNALYISLKEKNFGPHASHILDELK